jgi:hypothetical protein
MKIEALQKCRGRPTIDELPEPWRSQSEQWRRYLFEKWRRERGSLPDWAKPILEGIAKRLGQTTREGRIAWSRWMRATKGGLHSQRRARMEGRDPAAKARHFLKLARARRKREQEEAKEKSKFQQSQQKANEQCLKKVSALLSMGTAPFS